MITTPEIICDLFSFLDKNQIERIQLVNQFWNNVIIRYKNILPLRELYKLSFRRNEIYLFQNFETIDNYLLRNRFHYKMNFDGINLSKGDMSSEYSQGLSRYSQMTVDEVLTNLNNVVYNRINICFTNSEDCQEYFLNMIKLVATKAGGRFRGRYGTTYEGRFSSKLAEIFGKAFIKTKIKIHTN
jgi:hypothetical protein